MMKNFMDDLEKSAQKLKDAAMSPETKAKLEEAARAAGESVAAAVRFVKETAETVKPAAENAAQTVTKTAEDIAKAAREGYQGKAGASADQAEEPKASAADGQSHAGAGAEAKASADDLARAAGEGVAAAVKFFQDAMETARPTTEAFSKTASDLMKAAQAAYERKMDEGKPAADSEPPKPGAPKM